MTFEGWYSNKTGDTNPLKPLSWMLKGYVLESRPGKAGKTSHPPKKQLFLLQVF